MSAVSSPAVIAAGDSATGLHARADPGFEARLADSIDLLERAAAEHAGRIVQASSLGAEDMVITDLAATRRLDIAIATLDTGRLHPETVALIPRIEAHYRLAVEVLRPVDETVIAFVDRHGPGAMYQSVELRKACCGIRKLEPLSRMLAGRSAWVTGLRREQSTLRAVVPLQEEDPEGRVKFNPLAEWSWPDIWHYIAANDVPYNPLHDRFYPSIGCEPCTRAVALGEDFRAGRWWWEDEAAKECGLHVSDSVLSKEDISA